MTNAERQAAYRKRQKELGRRPASFLVTEDELFFIERMLLQMRKTGAVPAMMRRKNGTLEVFDA